MTLTEAFNSAIVIHNHRWRRSLAAAEAQYDDLEKRLARRPGDHRAHGYA